MIRFATRMLWMFAILVLLFALVSCGDDDGSDTDDGARVDAAMQVFDGAPMIDGATPQFDAAGTAAVEEVNCASVTADQTVNMEDIAFDPAAITIAPGEVIQWTNLDLVNHTVTSGRPADTDAGDLFDSGLIAQNGEYCLRFNDVGEYQYYCTEHPDIMDDGVVTVEQ